MKKVIVTLVLLVVSFSVKAQEKTAFEKDTYKLVEILTKPTLAPVISQFTSLVKTENATAFIKAVEATYPELYTSLSKIYMDEYTHDEIKQLLKFYESPLGQKVAKSSGKLAQKGMQAGQAWGMKVQGIMTKYQ
ncbi:DUF2059 domain-containing protein [Tenacibaculum amylolyticum]|uniref:DUF2059 domain-containing protein n=1 Tax=Tenacibaculum amylolyticum TaxID=104269 RepID=UPI00389347AD